MQSFKEFLGEGKNKHTFSVGKRVDHSDFQQSLTITKVHNDSKRYNTVDGVSGIEVKDSEGQTFDIWFDTETLRNKRAVPGSYNKIKKVY